MDVFAKYAKAQSQVEALHKYASVKVKTKVKAKVKHLILKAKYKAK